MPQSRLAGYGVRGKIWINPKVPKKFKGINVHKRLIRHERVERKLRQEGLTYRQAHKKALKAEHEGLSRRQIAQYSGKLGSIARWKPRKRKR